MSLNLIINIHYIHEIIINYIIKDKTNLVNYVIAIPKLLLDKKIKNKFYKQYIYKLKLNLPNRIKNSKFFNYHEKNVKTINIKNYPNLNIKVINYLKEYFNNYIYEITFINILKYFIRFYNIKGNQEFNIIFYSFLSNLTKIDLDDNIIDDNLLKILYILDINLKYMVLN